MSKQETKKQPEKKAEMVNLTNGMINGFQMNRSIKKLSKAQGIRAELKYKLFRLIETINGSPEAKALQGLMEEVIKTHKESQKDLEEGKRQPLLLDAPEVQEILNLESGLKVNKLIVPVEQLPPDFSADDMLVTGWIFEFEE